MANRLQAGFDYWEPIPKDELCPCCKKRRLPDGYCTCQTCGGVKVQYCTRCKVGLAGRSPSGKRRKLCDDCIKKPSTYPDGIPYEWRNKISNTVSGLRQRARFRGEGNAAKETELATLLKLQGFRCAVTAELLEPNKSTQLGHIVPGSKGGSHGISNLMWITKEVNRMMKDMSLDEFRAFCELVVSHQTTVNAADNNQGPS